MTDLDTFLEHHGVKGMKWGVRRDNAGAGKQASEKKIAKLDKKFERGATSKQYFAVYNSMAEKMNKTEIDRINNDPRFKGKDMSKPSKLQDAYYKEYSDTATKALNEASASIIGSNASGTKVVKFEYDVTKTAFPTCAIYDADRVKHADDAQEIELEVDDNWFILSMKLPSTIEHSEESLKHYGVKGMKWGVSRASGSNGRTKREQKEVNRRVDAKKRRRVLSDKDLDGLVKRLEQEKKLKTLLDDDLSPGKNFANQITRNAGSKVLTAVAAGAGMYVVRGVLTKEWGLGELASNIPKIKK